MHVKAEGILNFTWVLLHTAAESPNGLGNAYLKRFARRDNRA